MAKYKFEQFKIEIDNPTISANKDSIHLQVNKNTISVDVTMEVNGAKFGVHLTDIKVSNLNYEGYDNLMDKVLTRLKDFEV
jgi:hypothetical protein